MIGLLIEVMVALGFVALGLELLALSPPTVSIPVGLTGPSLSNSLPQRRQHPIQSQTPSSSVVTSRSKPHASPCMDTTFPWEEATC
jgi:hypothetical protein